MLYDPNDLGEVLAVNEDGTLRYMLTEKYVQPMALADRTAGDALELQKVHDFNDRLEEHVTGELARTWEICEELGRKDPRVANELNRWCLCDSRGQHKNQREAKRLELESGKSIAVEVTAPTPTPTPKQEEVNDYSIF